MARYVHSDSSFAEIAEGKARRREELMRAVRAASDTDLEGPAERLREAMRKREGEGRRKRIPPPVFPEQ